MNSLTITLKTSETERYIPNEVITTLYNIGKDDDENQSLTNGVDTTDSNRPVTSVVGSVAVRVAYANQIDYLAVKFPNLNISPDATYVYFEDPVFGQACINKYSTDGVGVTKALLAAVSSPSNLITSNSVWTSSLGDKTAVTSLEDFKYFSGIINSNKNVVSGFTNATKIVFPPVTFYYDNTYTLNLIENCRNLLDIDYQNAVFSSPNTGLLLVIYRNDVIEEWNSSLIPNQTDFRNIVLFLNWSKLKKVIFPEGITVTAERYRACQSLLYIEYPTTITDIGGSWDFGRETGHGIPAMVIKAVTPPNWYGYNPNDTSLNKRGFGYDTFPLGIYVPDNSVTAYKSFVNGGTNNEQAWASDYIKDRIKPLSELPLIYREMGTVTQEDIDRV